MTGVHTLEVSVDLGLCMSAGECVFHAPNTFAFDENAKSRVVSVDVDSEEDIIVAAQCCPNFAITVVRDGHRLV